MKTLFGLMVTLVILYGCEVWDGSMSEHKWRQVERIQKHFITCNLKVKTTVSYEILLAEILWYRGLDFKIACDEVFLNSFYLSPSLFRHTTAPHFTSIKNNRSDQKAKKIFHGRPITCFVKSIMPSSPP